MVTFQAAIQEKPIQLARAALSFAREIAYPALDAGRYLNRLDELADDTRRVVLAGDSLLAQAIAVAEYLFGESGFTGNTQFYHDPRKSYLNEVLDRRLGIPITLSVIFIEVGKRLNLPIQGVGMPGHFIVSIQGLNGPLFLDPFHGGRLLSVIDCARLVELSTGYNGPFQPDWLKAIGTEEILARMLMNLRNIYIQDNDWLMALPVVERLQALQPDHPGHLRDLGTIHHQNGSLRLAIEYFQQYLSVAPEADDASLVRRNLFETAEKMARRN